MANVILIKRGQAVNINSANLREGELALGFNADKSAVGLYAGAGNGKVILTNPDITSDLTGILNQAKSYADNKITALVNGAPEAMDTLQELAQAISDHEDAYEALLAVAGNKVDKVEGKGLSSNDYTDAEKNKLEGIATGAQVNSITGVKGEGEDSYRTGDVNITKANMGLGNVDNTSDADKPVSTATQTALDDKMDADATIDGGTF